MAAPAGAVDVRALIDRRIGPYQILVLMICFMISLIDGVDSQAPSVTGPMMVTELHLSPSMLGPILSASPWGALFGALVFGVCADHWGRRPVLIGCSALFGCATLATAWSDSFATLLVLRLLTGIGIGGALASFFALSAEYAPLRHRAGVVAIIATAVPLGGILVGFVGASLLTEFGWRVVYIASGVASIGIGLLALAILPESLSFMIIRGTDPARIRSVLSRIAPKSLDPSASQFFIGEKSPPGISVKHLFTEGRAPITILIWGACAINYAVLIGVLVWTPTLMKQTGMSLAEGSLAFTFNNIGGIVGVICSGQIVDRLRFSSFPVFSAIALCGTIATALIGYAAPNFLAVAAFSALAGFFLATLAGGLYSVAAVLIYPTFVRSTGVGWSSSFGRLGSSIGPLLVGLMFAAGWDVSIEFLGLAVIAAFNIVVVAAMGVIVRPLDAARHQGAKVLA
jgi:AAHS family 4-hydroxybenzoate transporter-like MFS transporter